MHGHYPATRRRAFPGVARAFRATEESEPAIIIPLADKRKPPAIFHGDVFISRLVPYTWIHFHVERVPASRLAKRRPTG
jgi:hypothetical protein